MVGPKEGPGLSHPSVQITGYQFYAKFPFTSRMFFLVFHAHEYYGEWPEMPTLSVAAGETKNRQRYL